MAVMQNGGRVDVVGDYLVMATLKKFDEEGRHAVVTEEKVEVSVKLEDVKEASYTRAARRGDHGTLVVKTDNGELLMRVLDEDAHDLMAVLRNPVQHVSDVDSSGSSDE